MKKRRDLCPDLAAATAAVQRIRESIHAITADVYGAYENEYSIFCPMSNCFEVYGLDFMVDEDLQVHFLEVNPGPDFKQTGNRLQGLISQLWEQISTIVVDSGLIHPSVTSGEKSHAEVDAELGPQWAQNAKDFTLVYSKEWSAAKHKGGMTFIKD
jgi:tubulin--tyrosine ligase